MHTIFYFYIAFHFFPPAAFEHTVFVFLLLPTIMTDGGAKKEEKKNGECDVKLKITTYLMQLNIFDIDANKMLMNNFRNKGVENSFLTQY